MSADGVGGAEGVPEVVALEAGSVVDLDPGLLEQFDPGGFELVGDEHTRHGVGTPLAFGQGTRLVYDRESGEAVAAAEV